MQTVCNWIAQEDYSIHTENQRFPGRCYTSYLLKNKEEEIESESTKMQNSMILWKIESESTKMENSMILWKRERVHKVY